MKRPRASADVNAVKSHLPGGSAVGRQQADFCSGLLMRPEECAHKCAANGATVTAPAETLHGGKN